MEFIDRIDPQLRDGLAFYDLIGLSTSQRLEGEVIDQIRRDGDAAIDRVFAQIPPDPRVDREDHLIPGPGGDLLLRIYRPAGRSEPLPAVVWLHGGGMMFGNVIVDGPACERYAHDAACVIVSVEYRLAPEHPYPAAVEDAYTALTWVAENAAEIAVDPSRLGVGGESAGGGLAAGLALLSRDRGGPPLVAQVLVYPMLDDRNDTPSAHEFPEIVSWSRQHNDGGWRAYLGDRAGGASVESYAAPARATDLTGLPPALIQVGELEIFRDECIDYAARLLRSGVSTELHVYPGAYHSWDVAAPESAQSIRAFAERAEWMSRVLQ